MTRSFIAFDVAAVAPADLAISLDAVRLADRIAREIEVELPRLRSIVNVVTPEFVAYEAMPMAETKSARGAQ